MLDASQGRREIGVLVDSIPETVARATLGQKEQMEQLTRSHPDPEDKGREKGPLSWLGRKQEKIKN